MANEELKDWPVERLRRLSQGKSVLASCIVRRRCCASSSVNHPFFTERRMSLCALLFTWTRLTQRHWLTTGTGWMSEDMQ
jgi:hypothetical protein